VREDRRRRQKKKKTEEEKKKKKRGEDARASVAHRSQRETVSPLALLATTTTYLFHSYILPSLPSLP